MEVPFDDPIEITAALVADPAGPDGGSCATPREIFGGDMTRQQRAFDGEEPADVDLARAVCRRCPVFDECASVARLAFANDGILAGTTAAERERRRTKADRVEYRRRQVRGLVARGLTDDQMAELLDVDRSLIGRDRAALGLSPARHRVAKFTSRRRGRAPHRPV